MNSTPVPNAARIIAWAFLVGLGAGNMAYYSLFSLVLMLGGDSPFRPSYVVVVAVGAVTLLMAWHMKRLHECRRSLDAGWIGVGLTLGLCIGLPFSVMSVPVP